MSISKPVRLVSKKADMSYFLLFVQRGHNCLAYFHCVVRYIICSHWTPILTLFLILCLFHSSLCRELSIVLWNGNSIQHSLVGKQYSIHKDTNVFIVRTSAGKTIVWEFRARRIHFQNFVVTVVLTHTVIMTWLAPARTRDNTGTSVPNPSRIRCTGTRMRQLLSQNTRQSIE